MSKHSYSPETAEKILNRIMDGEMLTKICAEDDMPTRREFYGWMAIRRTIPSISDRPPEEIFGVMKQALLIHFREKTTTPD